MLQDKYLYYRLNCSVVEKTLLILNYAMDINDPVFPHQIGIVEGLAKHWPKVYVITNKELPESVELPRNVKVYSLNWQNSSKLILPFKLLYFFLKIWLKEPKIVIFSHMTETNSALLAPVTKLLRIKHYLWYAHTSKPLRIRLCLLLVTKIVTSTQDSFPISHKKVISIGQGVDENIFLHSKNRNYNRVKFGIHVGRIDPSKRIDELISIFLQNFKSEDSKIQLVGSPSKNNFDYYQMLKNKYKMPIDSGRVCFLGNLNQEKIRKLLNDSDFFLHGFQGSLDKSLIEATLTGITVITCNNEYLKYFPTLIDRNYLNDIEYLGNQIDFLKNMSINSKISLANQRYSVALQNHSRSQWLHKLNNILNSGGNSNFFAKDKIAL